MLTGLKWWGRIEVLISFFVDIEAQCCFLIPYTQLREVSKLLLQLENLWFPGSVILVFWNLVLRFSLSPKSALRNCLENLTSEKIKARNKLDYKIDWFPGFRSLDIFNPIPKPQKQNKKVFGNILPVRGLMKTKTLFLQKPHKSLDSKVFLSILFRLQWYLERSLLLVHWFMHVPFKKIFYKIPHFKKLNEKNELHGPINIYPLAAAKAQEERFTVTDCIRILFLNNIYRICSWYWINSTETQ